MNTSTLNETCCQPDAPWVKCSVCGKPLKTCESDELIKGTLYTYVCPVHPDGVEVHKDYWLCDYCYDYLVDFYDE